MRQKSCREVPDFLKSVFCFINVEPNDLLGVRDDFQVQCDCFANSSSSFF